MADAPRWLELIQETISKTKSLYNEKQFDQIGQFYAEDVRVFPPGNPETKGREALLKAQKEVSDNGGCKANISDVEILEKTNEWALAKHSFVISTEQGRPLFHAKMIHMWRLKDGEPEMTMTMWNFDDTIQV